MLIKRAARAAVSKVTYPKKSTSFLHFKPHPQQAKWTPYTKSQSRLSDSQIAWWANVLPIISVTQNKGYHHLFGLSGIMGTILLIQEASRCEEIEQQTVDDVPSQARRNDATLIDPRLVRYDQRPTYYTYAKLSEHVYGDIKKDDQITIDGHIWKVHEVHFDSYSNYFGAIYINENTQQVVLAHRGTIPTKLQDWRDNFLGVYGNSIQPKQRPMYNFTEIAVKYAQQTGQELYITGHSLGGWLAQLSMFFAKDSLACNAVSGVTFDSPGIDEILENHYHTNLKVMRTSFAEMDLVEYVSYPNIVNTCGNHLGTVIQIQPTLTHWSEWPLFYTLESHRKENFSTELLKNDTMLIIRDWPLYHGELANYFKQARYEAGRWVLSQLEANKFDTYYRTHYRALELQGQPLSLKHHLPLRHFSPELKKLLVDFTRHNYLAWAAEQDIHLLKNELINFGIPEHIANLLLSYKLSNDDGVTASFLSIYADKLDISVSEFRTRLSKWLSENPEKIPLLFSKKAKALPPQWKLPSQNPFFLPRKSLDLHSKFLSITSKQTTNPHRIVLYAQGGMGKTQVALQYAHNAYKGKSYQSVIWFEARKLSQEYRSFAEAIGKINPDESCNVDKIKEFVKNALAAQDATCLIIYNDAKNYNSIKDYLPIGGNHHIVITSQDARWNGFEPIKVESMKEEKETAIELFKKHTGRTNFSKDELTIIPVLVEKLGYHPLAIATAGDHFGIYRSESMKDYLSDTKKRIDLLKTKFSTHTADKYPLSFYAVCQGSLEAMQKEIISVLGMDRASLILKVFTICAYLGSENIPKGILLEWIKQAYPCKPAEAEKVMDEVIHHFENHSLMVTSQDKQYFIMDSATQDVMQNLDAQETVQSKAGTTENLIALSAVLHDFFEGEKNSKSGLRLFVSHTKPLLKRLVEINNTPGNKDDALSAAIKRAHQDLYKALRTLGEEKEALEYGNKACQAILNKGKVSKEEFDFMVGNNGVINVNSDFGRHLNKITYTENALTFCEKLQNISPSLISRMEDAQHCDFIFTYARAFWHKARVLQMTGKAEALETYKEAEKKLKELGNLSYEINADTGQGKITFDSTLAGSSPEYRMKFLTLWGMIRAGERASGNTNNISEEEILAYYQEALNLCEQQLVQAPTDTYLLERKAQYQSNIGQYLFYSCKRTEEGISCLEKALQTLVGISGRQIYTAETVNNSIVVNNLRDAYLKKHKEVKSSGDTSYLGKVVALFKEHLELAEKAYGKKHHITMHYQGELEKYTKELEQHSEKNVQSKGTTNNSAVHSVLFETNQRESKPGSERCSSNASSKP